MFLIVDLEDTDISDPVKTFDEATKLAKKELSGCRGGEITIWKKIATVERDVKISITKEKE